MLDINFLWILQIYFKVVYILYVNTSQRTTITSRSVHPPTHFSPLKLSSLLIPPLSPFRCPSPYLPLSFLIDHFLISQNWHWTSWINLQYYCCQSNTSHPLLSVCIPEWIWHRGTSSLSASLRNQKHQWVPESNCIMCCVGLGIRCGLEPGAGFSVSQPTL